MEILVVVLMLSIVLGVGYRGLQAFREGSIVERASRAIEGDVSLTRSYAVQRRQTMELVADEAARHYVIRVQSSGDTLVSRSFDASADLSLTTLDVGLGGNSLTFDSRGLLVDGGVATTDTIEIVRRDRSRRLIISPMGRIRTETP